MHRHTANSAYFLSQHGKIEDICQESPGLARGRLCDAVRRSDRLVARQACSGSDRAGSHPLYSHVAIFNTGPFHRRLCSFKSLATIGSISDDDLHRESKD